jgi:hypothetical protein
MLKRDLISIVEKKFAEDPKYRKEIGAFVAETMENSTNLAAVLAKDVAKQQEHPDFGYTELQCIMGFLMTASALYYERIILNVIPDADQDEQIRLTVQTMVEMLDLIQQIACRAPSIPNDEPDPNP